MRETRRDVHERAPLSSPSPRAELGYTRVEPIIERPKSETSDFGMRRHASQLRRTAVFGVRAPGRRGKGSSW